MGISYSRIPEIYIDSFHTGRILENLRRFKTMPFIVIGLSLLYLLKYKIENTNGNVPEYVSSYSIIFGVMIILSLVFVLFNFICKRKVPLKTVDKVHHFYIFILFLLCVGLTAAKLQVSEDFSGYIIGILVMAFLLRTEPWKFLLMSVLGIALFHISLVFFFSYVLTLDVFLITLVVFVLSLFMFINRENRLQDMFLLRKQLEETALRDPLTNAFNRRHMIEFLNKELAKFRRTKTATSVMMIDIDHFKRINDEYDHSIGDLVLKEFTEIINENIRDTDLLCRYGGEEFLVILSGADSGVAFKIAERIRKKIADYNFSELSCNVTASFGVAAFSEEDDEISIIKRADQLLYKAKRAGRNQTCI